MSRPIIFGDIDGIDESHLFQGRKEMMPSSFHRQWGSGIDGNGADGTAAIVLSGGYEDDFDEGDHIVYTGAGGNKNGKQVEDQTWDNAGNAGLLVSEDKGLPVRVIRGHDHNSEFSPSAGYQYAGLYSVVESWQEIGKSGYEICRFRLVYSGDNYAPETGRRSVLDYTTGEKRRVKSTILRVVRDTKKANQLKELYEYKCQVCGTAIKTKKGLYAEGAHIKPLGKPHNGDDNLNNLLCLCPNHHVMFDKGSFSISNSLELLGVMEGSLEIYKEHSINPSNLEYHRKAHGFNKEY